MKTTAWFAFVLLHCFFVLDTLAQVNSQTSSALKITFLNSIKNVPVILDSTNYTNCWNESFTLHKLKYYISNIKLETADKKIIHEKNSYHLVDEEDATSKSFSIFMPSNQYTSLSFLIGVDSLRNVSGAQTDALDPLNGMFWTWNSGYIMFKMEAYSPRSAVVTNRIEYHIGGFSGAFNVLRNVQLNFSGSPVSIKKESSTEIIIQTNLDKIWNASHELKITKTPVCHNTRCISLGHCR